jgi:hypothetical protein
VRLGPGSVAGPRGGKERGKERLPGWAVRERRERWVGLARLGRALGEKERVKAT